MTSGPTRFEARSTREYLEIEIGKPFSFDLSELYKIKGAYSFVEAGLPYLSLSPAGILTGTVKKEDLKEIGGGFGKGSYWPDLFQVSIELANGVQIRVDQFIRVPNPGEQPSTTEPQDDRLEVTPIKGYLYGRLGKPFSFDLSARYGIKGEYTLLNGPSWISSVSKQGTIAGLVKEDAPAKDVLINTTFRVSIKLQDGQEIIMRDRVAMSLEDTHTTKTGSYVEVIEN